jgi:hypothetical protein
MTYLQPSRVTRRESFAGKKGKVPQGNNPSYIPSHQKCAYLFSYANKRSHFHLFITHGRQCQKTYFGIAFCLGVPLFVIIGSMASIYLKCTSTAYDSAHMIDVGQLQTSSGSASNPMGIGTASIGCH